MMETPLEPTTEGYICSGCGIHTETNYDDKGAGSVAPICKKCREEWDRACKPELKIIKEKPDSEWLMFEHTLTRWLDFLQMLKDYRYSIGLETIIDIDCQDVANRFIQEQRYLGEDQGIVWLNSEWENEKWHNKGISIFYLEYDHQRRYTDFIDIFRRDETVKALSKKNLKIGTASDKTGVILILAQKANLHNPYQTA